MDEYFFKSEDMKMLLYNKFMVIIGDSIQRSIYKDLVVLWKGNRYISNEELRRKGEYKFCGDELIYRSELTNGTDYREVREFKRRRVCIRFYFATRIYNEYIESVLKEFEDGALPPPDVVLVNSCLWDIKRYGKSDLLDYLSNLDKFCSRLNMAVPASTLKIWRTTLPISSMARGGFLGDRSPDPSLVHRIPLANFHSCSIVPVHRFNIINMYNVFIHQLQCLMDDGVHWNTFAHRRMTNIILTHIFNSWWMKMLTPDSPLHNVKLQVAPILSS